MYVWSPLSSNSLVIMKDWRKTILISGSLKSDEAPSRAKVRPSWVSGLCNCRIIHTLVGEHYSLLQAAECAPEKSLVLVRSSRGETLYPGEQWGYSGPVVVSSSDWCRSNSRELKDASPSSWHWQMPEFLQLGFLRNPQKKHQNQDSLRKERPFRRTWKLPWQAVHETVKLLL